MQTKQTIDSKKSSKKRVRLSPSDIRKLQAAIEAKQELARRHLIDFIEYTNRRYQTDRMHRLIAETVEHFVAGEIDKRILIVTAPPQHGKSEIISVRFPSWYIGRNPQNKILLATYSDALARTHALHARDVIQSYRYQEIFMARLRKDSQSKQDWEIVGAGGGMYSAGIGSSFTGRGAILGIIDDPIKDWREAQSQLIRDNAWDWLRSVFMTRLADDGKLILLMTRWHEDDPAGRILNDFGDDTTLLRLPAIAETPKTRKQNAEYLGVIEYADPLQREPGEPLAPRRFSIETLQDRKEKLGSRLFGALYQGVPRPAEGDRIKRKWLKIIREMPSNGVRIVSRVRYWDKAATADAGCYTAGVLLARTSEGKIIIEHVIRGQWSSGKRDEIIRETCERDKLKYHGQLSTWFEQEPGSSGKEVAESMMHSLAKFGVRADRPAGNKDVRLEPFAIQAEAGNVFLLAAKWNKDYIDEIIAVPNGTFRDQADATAGALLKLLEQGSMQPPSEIMQAPKGAFMRRR